MVLLSCLRRRAGFAGQHYPALVLRDRAAFLDADNVAGLELVGFIVGRVLLRPSDELLVDRVHDAPLDPHDNRLVLLVADHQPLQNPFRHLSYSAAPARWPSTVFIRAISRRI